MRSRLLYARFMRNDISYNLFISFYVTDQQTDIHVKICRYYRLDSDGPKIQEVSEKHPLAPR